MKFTPQQLEFLDMFLQRTPLTGREAFAYCELYAVVMKMREEQAPRQPAPPVLSEK